MEQENLGSKLTYAAKKKLELVEKSPMRYFVRAMLATLYLTIATTIAFLISEQVQNLLLLIVPMSETSGDVIYNITKIVYALIFGWALIMILFMNGELFTSNAMYFTSQVFTKTIQKGKAFKVLAICYLGNFVGAILTSLLLVFSNTFTSANVHFAEHVVLAKLDKDPLTVVLQGIVANLIVNIAVVLALNLKDDIAKIIAVLFMVFVFAYFGSEHVIANFASFSLVGFNTGFSGMGIGAILSNFFFATIGNVIGGGVLIGIVYAWLNQGEYKYKD